MDLMRIPGYLSKQASAAQVCVLGKRETEVSNEAVSETSRLIANPHSLLRISAASPQKDIHHEDILGAFSNSGMIDRKTDVFESSD
jgi:hypothetical protein